MKQGKKVQKKRSITAPEYINFKSQMKQGTSPLKSKRICLINDGIYLIVNYFPEIDGAPMLGIIQVKTQISSIELPPFIKVSREVTDEMGYSAEVMAKEGYKMDAKDKKETAG